ncbi:MAG: hypothetical protein WC358_02320 [Ignavibacteria bacterium]|jgi:hypothetical protein
MGIVDITNIGSSIASTAKSTSNRNFIGRQIAKVESFTDSIKIDKCYQFGSSAMGAVASSVSGDCTTNILDEIGTLLKNNAVMRYITSGVDTINNAIDAVKSFGKKVVGSVVNSPLGISIRAFYCGVLAPAMQILLMAIKSLIAIPLTILNALYKIIQKIKDIANNLTNKLFDCFGAFLQGMQDSVGTLGVNFQFQFNDLFSFLDDVENFLRNCEVISGPMIDIFNGLVNYCSATSMRGIFNKIGMTSEDEDISFCSAADVIAFLERRKNIKLVDLDELNELLNKFNPFNGLLNGAKKLNELGRSYVQYGIASVYEKAMAPLHKLEDMYNNFLRTRSRLLGILVNNTIGWLFPDCGSSKFEDGIIKRSRYSILDVVNILDSMNTCNSYICGNINNQVSEMLAELELSKYGRWINPIVKANDNLTKYLDTMFAETFGTDGEIASTKAAEGHVNMDFLKSILPYSNTLKAVY